VTIRSWRSRYRSLARSLADHGQVALIRHPICAGSQRATGDGRRATGDGPLRTHGRYPVVLLILRRSYVVWSWVIAAAVVVQVLLAGLYVFGSASIEAHVINGSVLLFATLLGGIVALVARIPRRVAAANLGLFGLVMLQVVLIEVGNAAGVPVLKAFHVVNALAVFGVSSVLALRSLAYYTAPDTGLLSLVRSPTRNSVTNRLMPRMTSPACENTEASVYASTRAPETENV